MRISNKVTSLSGCESRQLNEFDHDLNGKLDVFLFISPLKTQQDFGVIQKAYPRATVALSRNIQLHTRRPHFNGYCHFILLCCGPITLIVPLNQSAWVLKNRGFHLTSDPVESDHTYIIPSENERAALLPVGVWAILEQIAEETSSDFSMVFRFTSSSAKMPNVQPTPPMDNPVIIEDHKILLQYNFLPKGYEIIKPFTRISHSQRVMLPEGHHVILHSALSVSSQNTDFTLLLCADESKSTPLHKSLYSIFIAKNGKAHFLYLDGATVEVKDNKLTVTKFLQQNKIANVMRYDLPGLQQLLNRILPNKHFDNVELLVHLVNYRRFVIWHDLLTIAKYCYHRVQ